jgi:hypothetical protein
LSFLQATKVMADKMNSPATTLVNEEIIFITKHFKK